MSYPALWRRLAIGVFVCVAALPAIPLWGVLAWLFCWISVSTWERAVARRQGHVPANLTGCLVSFALALVQALAAVALILKGDVGARFFAVALVGLSSVNILLRFYAAPRMLLISMAPYAAVLGWVSSVLIARYAGAGDWLRLLTPLATLGVYVLLVWPTRRKLMDAWVRLVDARAEALQGKRTAELASRAKSDFLATMSHEIRTPLNGILGVAQAMQTAGLAPEHKARLQVIRGCGETLLAILNDVLDLSKVEAGQLRIEPQEFDMEHVTRGAVATFGPMAAKQGLDLAYSIEEEAKGVFLGDPVRLRQVLYNLASNAVKFTDHGGVAVCVGYAHGMLRVEVADSGAGIPPAKLDSVFEKFVQGDASATRRAGGAGLGLAICRELVALMGGTIQASSTEGKGSVFTVTLPMERLAAPEPLREPAREIGEVEEPFAPMRILAAEDNEVNRLVLATLLRQSNIDLSLVENGAEAVTASRTGDWDLILMDIQMPLMDGVSATRAIRAEELRGPRRRTPIIALTANVMPEQRAEYVEAGMDFVLAKPIEAGELFRAIERAVAGELAAAEAA